MPELSLLPLLTWSSETHSVHMTVNKSILTNHFKKLFYVSLNTEATFFELVKPEERGLGMAPLITSFIYFWPVLICSLANYCIGHSSAGSTSNYTPGIDKGHTDIFFIKIDWYKLYHD